ncbi:TRAUB-domain-containing protein [Phanerochaete sordida]|uniref:Protein BFR2 n=1 Tax=Phanerochaete sordida TaxID=48140 RepID=A0A9P3LD34_9APHY|nr:TRAUB-domain-containing protein [Phanerochaete sordida]
MAARIPLAQQIALLSEAAPADLDPDDLHLQGPQSEDESHEANLGARDHYVAVGPSSLRQLNQSISDPKYVGTRVSRRDLEYSEDSIGETESDEEDQSEDDEHPDEEDAHDSRELPVQNVRPAHRGLSPDAHAPAQASLTSPQHDFGTSSDLTSTLRATREQDRRKGKAVSRQMMVWDTLLDGRIRLQKASTTANQLTSLSNTARQQAPALASLNDMLDEAVLLSQDLFALQESLSKADASPAFPPRKRVKLSHDNENEYAQTLTALSSDASAFEAAHHPHLVQVLAKWSAKVQAVAPNVLLPTNRGSFKSAFTGKSAPAGVVDVIAETLRADGGKLLVRTRLSRSAEAVDLEHTSGDMEVFDDTDFYQQLLRDVIDARGSGGEGGEPEWIQRQKANKARRKKTVDVKASKGRKLRYQVHEKLQNFMVPITVAKGQWHDEQVDELFASLLRSTS